MRVLIFIMSLVISSTFASNIKGEGKIWGKIVKKPAHYKDGLDFNYYITYKKDGRNYAYPVEVATKELEKKVNQNIGNIIKAQGSVRAIDFEKDGESSKLLVFRITNLSPMQLSNLQLKEKDVPNIEKTVPKKKAYEPGGIELSDKAANTAIFAAGAILLGNILTH